MTEEQREAIGRRLMNSDTPFPKNWKEVIDIAASEVERERQRIADKVAAWRDALDKYELDYQSTYKWLGEILNQLRNETK